MFCFSEITSAQIKPKVKKYPTQHICNSSCKESNHCYRHVENSHTCAMNNVNQKMEIYKCNSDCISKKKCCRHMEKKHSCCENKPKMPKEIDKIEGEIEEKTEK